MKPHMIFGNVTNVNYAIEKDTNTNDQILTS